MSRPGPKSGQAVPGLRDERPRLTAPVGATSWQARRGPGAADRHALLDVQLPGADEDAVDDLGHDFAALVVVESAPATLELGRERQRVDRVRVADGRELQPRSAHALIAGGNSGDIGVLAQRVQDA